MDEQPPPEPAPRPVPGESHAGGPLERLRTARRRRADRSRVLRWSTPVEDVVRHVVSDQAVAFWFEPRGLISPRARARVLMLPLGDVAVPGLDPSPLPGVGAEHWLVWQSLTSTGHPTRIPTDAGRLADLLGVGRGRATAFFEDGMTELMAAIYESRAT